MFNVDSLQLRSAISVQLPLVVTDLPPTRLPLLAKRLEEILVYMLIASRLLILATAVSSIAGSTTAEFYGIGICIAITSAMLITEQRFRIPFWARMICDCFTISLLISLTGSVASPILGVVLMLIPISALHGGSRDVIAATCTGVMLLLIVGIVDMPIISETFYLMLCAHFLIGVFVAWLCTKIHSAVVCLYTGVQTHTALVKSKTDSNQLSQWQHANRSISEAQSKAELITIARQQASAIVGTTVDICIDGRFQPERISKTNSFVIATEGMMQPSVMIVHINPTQIDQMQHDALVQLLLLVRMRSDMLITTEQRTRDCDALEALWKLGRLHSTQPTKTNHSTNANHIVSLFGLTGIACVSLTPHQSFEVNWQTTQMENALEVLLGASQAHLFQAMSDMSCQLVTEDTYLVPTIKAGGAVSAYLFCGNVNDSNTQRMLKLATDALLHDD